MLLSKVRRAITRHGLLEQGDKVLVACSGGADSTALLTALLELSGEYKLRIAVAHFNHGLRRAANEDERFVVRLAHELGLPVYVRREDIRAFAARHGRNIEEAGRERRYKFLRETARRVGACRIATGHTLADQAETVLMRILRGTGPTGLGGIAPLIDGWIVRPLIEVERREVEAYLRVRKIRHREDVSNRNLLLKRNRVRHRLIPYIERTLEPRIVEHLGTLAEICREEEHVWDGLVKAEEARSIRKKKGIVCLDARRLSSLPPAAGRRLVRAFLGSIKGDLRRLSFRDIEAVRCLAEQKGVTLPGKLLLRREEGLISVPEKRRAHQSYKINWDGKKDLLIPEIGLFFAGKRVEKGERKFPAYNDKKRALADAAELVFPLLIRARRDGDRYRPLGSPGRRKLKEIMRAKGVPVAERDNRPVFLSRGRIIWVPGLPIAEDFKITPATKTVFIIENLPRDSSFSKFRKPKAPRADG